MLTLTFLPSGATTEVAVGETLFDAGARVKANIQTSCVGKGTCGLCRVKIVSGETHLAPYTEIEQKHLGNLYAISKVRLACRTHVTSAQGEITVEVRLAPKRRPAG